MQALPVRQNKLAAWQSGCVHVPYLRVSGGWRMQVNVRCEDIYLLTRYDFIRVATLHQDRHMPQICIGLIGTSTLRKSLAITRLKTRAYCLLTCSSHAHYIRPTVPSG